MNLLEACESLRWVREVPDKSNRTPLGRLFGMDGVAWCGIAVWAAFMKVGVDLRKVLTPSMASTVAIQTAAKRRKWWFSPRQLQPGYIVGYHMPGGRKGINHVGIVKEVTSAGIWAYEGNTSGAGSQFDGGAYMLKFRPWSVVLGGIRIPNLEQLMTGQAPAPVVPVPPAPVTAPFRPIERPGVFKGQRGVPGLFALQLELAAVSQDQGVASEAAFAAERNAVEYGPQTQWRLGTFINVLLLNGNTEFRGHATEFISPNLFKALDFVYWLKTHQQPAPTS